MAVSQLTADRPHGIEIEANSEQSVQRPSENGKQPPQEIIGDAEAGPRKPVRTPPAPFAGSENEQQRRHTIPNEPVADASPRIADARTADQVFEQRLRASEKDLCDQLRFVPEVRLLSDEEVKSVRQEEKAAQQQREDAARAELNAARAKLDAAGNDRYAHQEAARAYHEVARRYQAVMGRGSQETAKIGYNFNVRLHQAMKRSAIQAGLELGAGPSCRLAPHIAAQVAELSKDLRDMGFVTVPGVSFVRPNKRGGVAVRGGVISPTSGSVTIIGNRVLPNGPVSRPADETTEDRITAFQSWCDQRRLEALSGTVPTLTQMLQIENEATRLLLVRELTRTKSRAATVELAIRALVDLSPEVRQAALAGLEKRPAEGYVPVLLRGLRYPWSPVADHAAVALRKLQPQEAAASLVDLLDLPSPSAPVFDPKTKQYTVREVVRLNHLRNCLLCHVPSANKEDGLVRGLVPTPGQPLPRLYYEGQNGDFVRADITFLRQDFSVNLHDEGVAPWPKEQRYDFVTRLRTVPESELALLPESSAAYPQRDAVLYALRGITGRDSGDSSARWRETLGISADKPTGEKKTPALENIAISPMDPDRSR